MKTKYILTLTVALLLGSEHTAAQQQSPQEENVVRNLQHFLDSIVVQHPKAVGIMVHVEAPDLSLSWSGAAGHQDKLKTKRIDPTQPALIASNVKTFMAAAILRLVEENKITTDQPIAKLISSKSAKQLIDDGYDLAAIKVSHLLSHTSGIHDYIDEDYLPFTKANPKHRWTREEQISLSVKVGDPLGAPGTIFQYADVNFLLLGEILERCTNKPFYTAIRDLVKYKEIGLNETWFFTLEHQPKLAKPMVHQYWTSMGFDSHEIDPSFDLYGAGGIAATTKDLARFSQSLFSGKVVRNRDTLNKIFMPAKTKDGTDHHYHFGLSSSTIAGYQAYGHGGFWGTTVQYLPKLNTSIAVFVLERDKRILRTDVLEGIVKLIAASDKRTSLPRKD